MSNVVQAKSEMHSKAMLISNTVYYMRFYVLADMSTKIYCSVGDPFIWAAGTMRAKEMSTMQSSKFVTIV